MRRFILVLCTLCAFPVIASAQALPVSGVVSDENGAPLLGVTVFEKDGRNGTATNTEGRYSMNVKKGVTLVFSYIGYETYECPYNGETTLNVTLKPDAKLMDEVVVIGYGAVKKKDLTGSVSAIKGDDLVARQTTTLSTALQGSVSGLLVTRDSGAPGASGTIKVRGITTMGDNNPLIIVDGSPCDNIDYVNANDVESVSVLKDAAAASIYGSKAAAGVILITTKRGAKERTNLTYNGEVGWEVPTMQPDMVGVTRYMEMYNELLYNDNPAAGFFQQYSSDQVKNWISYNKTNPNQYPLTDWKSLIMKDSALKHKHNVSISGGTDLVRTKVSFSYDDVDGLYGERKYQRMMLRANNDATIVKDKLFATVDINIRRGKNITPNFSPFDMMRKMPAIYAATWDDGRIAEGKSGANPYGLLVGGGNAKAWSTQVGGRASLEYKPVKGLSIQAVVSPFINYSKTKTFRPAVWYTLADDPETIGGYLDSGSSWSTNKLTEQRNDNYNVTSQVIANYIASFGRNGNHNLNVMVGYENYLMKSESLSAARDNFEFTQYPYLNVGSEDYQTNSGTGTEYTSNSVFGRIMYDYDGRYLLQANVRHDGSSRFAKKYRWGTFPSFSAGWVVTREKFMEGTESWLDFMKVRASWGMLGNERIGSNYFPYLALMTFNDVLFYDKDGNVVSDKSAAQRALAVEDITWETTTSTDIGVDLGLFRNRLSVNFDYYWKETKDMLLTINIPYIMGYNNPSSNAGTMKTNGYDIEVGWRDQVGDFSYGVSVNFSDFKSKVTDMNGSEQINGSRINRPGCYFNEWYGYVSDGIYQTQEEVDNSATYNSSVKVGDIRYKDISGPDGVPDGKINSDDKVPLGNSLPRWQYGGTVNLGWKGIDFSMAFQGIGRRTSYMATEMVQPIRDNYGNIPAIIDGKYWSPFNTDEQNRNAKYPRLSNTGKSNNYQTSDFWLFNGGYFRLKNVTLGYTLPRKWTQKIRMSNVRLYVSASDLFCISDYPKGWDPEMGVTSYPITTSILVGLSLKL
ncbi:SusC/RagA family TonB-linked outer membrane protein [Alistipes provencensis]|uniref:SusC/RagA family TonB-linked outer membrane protein n=1 Tax=Alistipes provencensis TaxID=1816676 RepID=UPI000ABA20DE|nr:TonB-dependent receptor [Alistipes provencensis]